MTRSARSGTDGGMSTPMACVAGRFSTSSKVRDRRGVGFAEAGVGRREMQIASTWLRRRFIASTASHVAASRRGTASGSRPSSPSAVLLPPGHNVTSLWSPLRSLPCFDVMVRDCKITLERSHESLF
jgi:hypothetical protein